MQAVQHWSCIGTGGCWLQPCDEACIGSPERFVSKADAEWPCTVMLMSLSSMKGGNLGSYICSASHAGQRSDYQTQPELLAYIAAMTAVCSDLERAWGLQSCAAAVAVAICSASCLTLQVVYADMSNNLLMHASVPALGLRSTHWSVISWARSQTARERFTDAKYVYRWASAAR